MTEVNNKMMKENSKKTIVKNDERNDERDVYSYGSGQLLKAQVIERLKTQGFRLTKQRKLLIDIILRENCSCCKEVYILASKKDPGIGMATVYRTVDALEQVGALKRRTAYQLCDQSGSVCKNCRIELEDGTLVELNSADVAKIIEDGMKKFGYGHGKKARGIQ
ncbi:MAG: transcriptional repressor [Clostridiales bacterium]|nr:transcriptional repressor [Clostridiales bacterium]MDY3746605.1 transcriptional repressor [Lachnospiraceae bacterium]